MDSVDFVYLEANDDIVLAAGAGKRAATTAKGEEIGLGGDAVQNRRSSWLVL